MGATAETYFEWSRRRIATNFGVVAKDWLREVRDRRTRPAIVIFGYSKTVREAIKEGIIGRRREGVADRRNAGVSGGRQIPIFLVHESPEVDLSTQRMRYELVEELELRPGIVAVCDCSQLLDFVRDGYSVLVLFGAEAFDSDGRILVSNAVVNLIQMIKNAFGGGDAARRGFSCKVILVAGGFKKCPIESLTVEAQFLNYHFGQLTVSPVKLADEIITEGLAT